MKLRIFVSHSHKDNTFAHSIVNTLKQMGADVWYDEEKLHAGELGPVIEREIQDRSIFILILSPDSLSSGWVEKEARWFELLYMYDRQRMIIPVVAQQIPEENSAEWRNWLFIRVFKRIEGQERKPLPFDEIVRRLTDALLYPPIR